MEKSWRLTGCEGIMVNIEFWENLKKAVGIHYTWGGYYYKSRKRETAKVGAGER